MHNTREPVTNYTIKHIIT